MVRYWGFVLVGGSTVFNGKIFLTTKYTKVMKACPDGSSFAHRVEGKKARKIIPHPPFVYLVSFVVSPFTPNTGEPSWFVGKDTVSKDLAVEDQPVIP